MFFVTISRISNAAEPERRRRATIVRWLNDEWIDPGPQFEKCKRGTSWPKLLLSIAAAAGNEAQAPDHRHGRDHAQSQREAPGATATRFSDVRISRPMTAAVDRRAGRRHPKTRHSSPGTAEITHSRNIFVRDSLVAWHGPSITSAEESGVKQVDTGSVQTQRPPPKSCQVPGL